MVETNPFDNCGHTVHNVGVIRMQLLPLDLK